MYIKQGCQINNEKIVRLVFLQMGKLSLSLSENVSELYKDTRFPWQI